MFIKVCWNNHVGASPEINPAFAATTRDNHVFSGSTPRAANQYLTHFLD